MMVTEKVTVQGIFRTKIILLKFRELSSTINLTNFYNA